MRFIPLDWQLNDSVPNAEEMFSASGLAKIIGVSVDPIYRQLDEAMPTWQVYGPNMNWQLLDLDYLYHPEIGTLVPVAMAWRGHEQILLYSLNVICIAQPDGSFTVGKLV
jgi:hypothetical protein